MYSTSSLNSNLQNNMKPRASASYNEVQMAEYLRQSRSNQSIQMINSDIKVAQYSMGMNESKEFLFPENPQHLDGDHKVIINATNPKLN